MKPCTCNREIRRDGSGQLSRYLKALDPTYAPIDGRSLEDILVFIKRYANQIRFYDIPGSMEADHVSPALAKKISWREFFRRDMAVIAATISVVDSGELRQEYDELRVHLDAHPTRSAFFHLFDPILGMMRQIDRWYTLAIPENPLRKDLELAIASSLAPQVATMLQYEAGYQFIDPQHPLDLDLTGLLNENLWGVNATVTPDATIFVGGTNEDKIRHAALYVDDIFHAFYHLVDTLVNVKAELYMQVALETYPAHQPHMALFIAFLQLFQIAQKQMNDLTGRMLDYYYTDILHLTSKASVPDRVHMVFELAKDVTQYAVTSGTELKGGKDASGAEQFYKTEEELVVNQAKVKELKNIFIQKGTEENTSIVNSIFARPIANSLDGQGTAITDPSGKWFTFGKGERVCTSPKNLGDEIELVREALTRTDPTQIGFAMASPQLLLQGGNRLIEVKFPQGSGVERLFGQTTLADGDDEDRKTTMLIPPTVEFWLTGADGWVKIAQPPMQQGNILKFLADIAKGVFNQTASPDKIEWYFLPDTQKLGIYLPIGIQEIVGYDAALHTEYSLATTKPVVAVVIKSEVQLTGEVYESLKLSDIGLRVKVGSLPVLPHVKTADGDQNRTQLYYDGLKALIVQNEEGVLDSTKPFDPFTPYPMDGKPFYIGGDELFNKPYSTASDMLSVHIRLTVENPQAPPFTFEPEVLASRQWLPLNTTNDAGISWGPSFTRDQLAHNILARGSNANAVVLSRLPITSPIEYSWREPKGFLRVILQNSGTIGATLETRQNLAVNLEVQEISVNYDSHLPKLEAGIDQFFHIYPFGVAEVRLSPRKVVDRSPSSEKTFCDYYDELRTNAAKTDIEDLLIDAKGKLLPQFAYTTSTASTTDKDASSAIYTVKGLGDKLQGTVNQYWGTTQEEGLLYIGIEKLVPLQSLSLLFQFAEGSAADEDNDPPVIHWSYLVGNEWRPLPDENLDSDGTYGFQTTGIVKISVPEDADTSHSIITDELHWFCMSVTEHADRIPMLINVVTQAVVAQFDDRGNASSHFDAALPASSIGKLAVPVAQVGKVQQPFASFDGKHAEIGKEYYTRVSERLRHKDRAINAWDYEHIVLDRFPQIYKVKAITHTDPNCLCRTASAKYVTDVTKRCCGPQVAPGHVLVVPIADLKNRNGANPLQPKTSRRLLLEIEDYLRLRISPFVKVHAKNPLYEEVLVSFKVQFYDGRDKGFYLKQLNDEIVEFLTPWAFNATADVEFGQKIYASKIINFIEERAYVDFITDFVMYVCHDCCCTPAKKKSQDYRKDASARALEDNMALRKGTSWEQVSASTSSSACMEGCDDMEALLSQEGRQGEIIAKPCSSRGILVSASKHIIEIYEAPEEPSVCKERTVPVDKAAPKPDQDVSERFREPAGQESGTVIDRMPIPVEPEREKPVLPARPDSGTVIDRVPIPVEPEREKPVLPARPDSGTVIDRMPIPVEPELEKPVQPARPESGTIINRISRPVEPESETRRIKRIATKTVKRKTPPTPRTRKTK